MSGAAKVKDESLRFGMRSRQPLMFGIFATNATGSVMLTQAPSSFEVSWEHSLKVARMVDRMGFDMIVPVARWRGFGGATNYAGETYETLTYMAGIAAVTENIATFTTIHVPLIHPVVAAKAVMTIDHISGGRAGLNIVMGWNEKEMAMFDVGLRPHRDRYAYGAEWMTIVDRLWSSEEPFDFEGEFFHLASCESLPRPIQRRPPVINAGTSATGIDFAARHADINFTSFTDFEQVERYSRSLKQRAFEERGREIGLLSIALIVCRETEAEARRDHAWLRENADIVASYNWAKSLGINVDAMPDEQREAFLATFAVTPGNAALVGTPEQIVDRLSEIKRAGIDGMLLGFHDYAKELPFFEERVMPLLIQQGLRV
jgi:alkanesulfonate monooxygenase SsuD/methylene tetrahydromethanopterin reductase-like flavin-dependent oxidoreductase (luciferase family)